MFKQKIQILLACLAGLGLLFSVTGNAEDYNPEIVVRTLLETDRTTLDQRINLPSIKNPKVTALLVEIPPGARTGWHVHPVYIFAYVLSGTVTVEFESGETRVFSADEAFSEAVNVVHNGVNNGPDPVRLIVFAIGESHEPLTTKQ